MKSSVLIRFFAFALVALPMSFLVAQESDVTRQNSQCIHCHLNHQGPFVYEHEVIKTEGCVSCHDADAAHKRHQMTRENINTLCWRCHAPSTSAPTGQPVSHVHDDRSRICTDCHHAVHGSKTSPLFLQEQRK